MASVYLVYINIYTVSCASSPSAVYIPAAISVIVSLWRTPAFLYSQCKKQSCDAAECRLERRRLHSQLLFLPQLQDISYQRRLFPSEAYGFHVNVSGKGVSGR